MLAIMFLLFACYLIYRSFSSSTRITPHGKYVLISGCDSGFGQALAIELDRQGYHVFAGVLIPDSVVSLTAKLSTNASVFRLDITKQDDIDAAFDLVTNKTKSLHALVNNAGIATGGFIDWTPMQVMRQVMEVNFFGHVAMTKKFLSLLIMKRDSRVVNMCSMCGFIGLPGSGAYCASKYALESFSDCLRREMHPWGLHVSVIEPGTMQTTMTDGMQPVLRKVWQDAPTDVRERWGEPFFQHLYQFVINSVFIRYAESPDKVIRAFEDAICSTAPKIRYRPGWQSSCVFFPFANLPVWLVDKMFTIGFRADPAGIKHQLKD